MKAMIITSQRSGSTFLRHCLNSHPQIACEAELLIGATVEVPRLFEDRRLPAKIYKYIRSGAWDPMGIIEAFMARDDAPVVAFKAMYNQLTKPKVQAFLREHKDIRIIHLRRDNLLKQYVSKMLLGKKRERRWQPFATQTVAPVATRISPQAAIRHMQWVQEQYEKFELLLAHHKKIELVYESMIEGQCLSEHATKAVCELLNIEYSTMCCNFVKINPDRLQLMVENYEELVEELRGTEYERFLDA